MGSYEQKANSTNFYQLMNNGIKLLPTVAVTGRSDWPCQREQKNALKPNYNTNVIKQDLKNTTHHKTAGMTGLSAGICTGMRGFGKCWLSCACPLSQQTWLVVQVCMRNLDSTFQNHTDQLIKNA